MIKVVIFISYCTMPNPFTDAGDGYWYLPPIFDTNMILISSQTDKKGINGSTI